MTKTIKICSFDKKPCGYVGGTGMCRKHIFVAQKGLNSVCCNRSDAIFVNPDIGWKSKDES